MLGRCLGEDYSKQREHQVQRSGGESTHGKFKEQQAARMAGGDLIAAEKMEIRAEC